MVFNIQGGQELWGQASVGQSVCAVAILSAVKFPAWGNDAIMYWEVYMGYDSTEDTQDHIGKVVDLIDRFLVHIARRGRSHDLSKLESPEKDLFDEYTPLLQETTYGSDEYKQYLKEMGEALEHHYEKNRHHPNHHKRGIDGMTLIDIVEMFCDWKAASMRHGDFAASLEHNRQRFNIGDQLHSIFVNTANELDLFNRDGAV